MRKAIYSVITGGYDSIPKAPSFSGWDAILFTDQTVVDYKGWQVRYIESTGNPIVESRDIKIRSHYHLPEYDLVCYIDGNQKLLREPPAEPIWFTHVRRKTIYQEARQLILNGRFPAEKINEQMAYYINEGYQDCSLYLNGFFVRDHTSDINYLHDIWFDETCRFVPRDQLTLPFAIWLTGVFPKNVISARYKEVYAIVKEPHQQLYDSTPHNKR